MAGRRRAKAAPWLADPCVHPVFGVVRGQGRVYVVSPADSAQKQLCGWPECVSRCAPEVLHHGRPISVCVYRCESMAVAMAGQPVAVHGSIAESTPSRETVPRGGRRRAKAAPWPSYVYSASTIGATMAGQPLRMHGAARAQRTPQPAGSQPTSLSMQFARARPPRSGRGGRFKSIWGKRSNLFIMQSTYVHISVASGLSNDRLHFSSQYNQALLIIISTAPCKGMAWSSKATKFPR